MANTITIHVRTVDNTRGYANVRAGAEKLSDDLGPIGERGGENLGEGIVRGADGRLRDARGRFVTMGKTIGDDIGAGIGDGISRGIGDGVRRSHGPLDSLTGRLAILGGAAHGLSAIFKPALFTAATPALLGVAAAAAEASGALLILPGVAASAGLAVGTLAIAMSGFSDALGETDTPAKAKKVAEALAAMSPAARETALAIRGLKAPFDELKQSLQENLFAGMANDIDATARSLMSSLQPAMDSIARSTGATFKGLLRDIRGVQSGIIEGIGVNAARAWDNLLQAVRPVWQALLDIADVGAKVFADITSGAGEAAASFAIWIRQLKESGRLEEIIRGGLDALKQLWEISKNVGTTLSGLFRGAGADGEGFLATLQRLTQSMSDWVNSARGQETIAAVFSAISAAVGLLGTAFLTLGPIIAGLMPVIDQLIGLLTTELPGGLSVAEVLIYGWAIKVAAHWAMVAKAAVKATIGMIIEVGAQLIQWAILSAGALAHAARIAAAWVMAMGPIGWAVAAMAAAAVLIVANWDTIRGHAEAFGQWFASDFPNFIRGGIDAAVQYITTTFPDGVRRGIDVVVNFFTTTLPDGVRRGIDAALQALSNVASRFAEVGRAIVDGIWRGIQAGWNWLTEQVRNLALSLFNAAKAALGIGSPSKLFRDAIGKMIPEGIAVGIKLNSGSVGSAINELIRRLMAEASARVRIPSGGSGSAGLEGMDLYRYRAAAFEKHRREWARRNPGKEDTNTTVRQFWPEYADAMDAGFRGTVKEFYSQYRRPGGSGASRPGGVAGVPGLTPTGALASKTLTSTFAGTGGMASITRANAAYAAEPWRHPGVWKGGGGSGGGRPWPPTGSRWLDELVNEIAEMIRGRGGDPDILYGRR